MKRLFLFVLAASLIIPPAWGGGAVPPAWGLVLRGTGGASTASKPAYPAELNTAATLAPDIAAYLFHQGYGSTTRNYVAHADSSILTNATAEEGLWVSDGLEFNANYEHVRGLLMSNLNGTGSIVFRFKKTSNPSNYRYWFVQDDDYANFCVVMSSAEHDFYIGNKVNYSDRTSYLDGNWHQMVYTWDDSANERKWYMDGALKQNLTTSFSWSGTAGDWLRIGGRPTGLGRFAGGIFEYFYIYDSVLTSTQISSLYADPYQMWASCGTEIQSASTESGTSREPIGDASDRMMAASRFTAAETATICSVKVRLKKVGSPDKAMNFAIFSDNSGQPGTRIGNWSTPYQTENLSTTLDSDILFGDIGAGIVSGTVYWLVGRVDGSADSSNYVQWRLGATVTDRELDKGDGAGNWVDEGAYNGIYWLYKR